MCKVLEICTLCYNGNEICSFFCKLWGLVLRLIVAKIGIQVLDDIVLTGLMYIGAQGREAVRDQEEER